MKKIGIVLLLILLLGSACNKVSSDETISDDTTQIQMKANEIIYPDYYTDVQPVISEYTALSIDLNSDSDILCEYKFDMCVTDEYVFIYDLLMDETNGDHTQNGIVGIDKNGNKLRFCPEKECTSESVCNHIVFKDEKIICDDNALYICGIPALNDDFYPNTCIMRLDLETKEYIKYAEIPLKDISLFRYGNYLFASTITGGESAVLYCFDLLKDAGYKYVFSSKEMGPSFIGVVYQNIVASDMKNLYLLDGKGNISQTYSMENEICNYDIYKGELFISFANDGIYRYNIDSNTCELVVNDGYVFDIYDDTIYYMLYKQVTGLKYLVPYEDENGYIAHKEEDYPLFYGDTIYAYSLITFENEALLLAENDHFLNGIISVSDFGFIYGYYIENEPVQKTFMSITALRDLSKNKETILTEFWNGRGRVYGQ